MKKGDFTWNEMSTQEYILFIPCYQITAQCQTQCLKILGGGDREILLLDDIGDVSIYLRVNISEVLVLESSQLP